MQHIATSDVLREALHRLTDGVDRDAIWAAFAIGRIPLVTTGDGSCFVYAVHGTNRLTSRQVATFRQRLWDRRAELEASRFARANDIGRPGSFISTDYIPAAASLLGRPIVLLQAGHARHLRVGVDGRQRLADTGNMATRVRAALRAGAANPEDGTIAVWYADSHFTMMLPASQVLPEMAARIATERGLGDADAATVAEMALEAFNYACIDLEPP